MKDAERLQEKFFPNKMSPSFAKTSQAFFKYSIKNDTIDLKNVIKLWQILWSNILLYHHNYYSLFAAASFSHLNRRKFTNTDRLVIVQKTLELELI
jgi:hypothetical protein